MLSTVYQLYSKNRVPINITRYNNIQKKNIGVQDSDTHTQVNSPVIFTLQIQIKQAINASKFIRPHSGKDFIFFRQFVCLNPRRVLFFIAVSFFTIRIL